MFGGNSYIKHSPITNVNDNLTISLLITPTANNGVILFNSFSDIDFSDREYIYLLIVNGFVEFRYDNGIGSEPVKLRSGIQLQLDKWHYIEASKYGHIGSLIVNRFMVDHLVYWCHYALMEVFGWVESMIANYVPFFHSTLFHENIYAMLLESILAFNFA